MHFESIHGREAQNGVEVLVSLSSSVEGPSSLSIPASAARKSKLRIEKVIHSTILHEHIL